MRKTLKRFLTTALCSATLVAAGLGVNALTTDVAAAEVEPAELKIAAQTLNVSDNVNMVYLVPVAAGAKSDITVYVTENDVETPIYADATNATYGENEYYRFIYRGITAYEMDVNLYAYAEMGGVKSEEVKYSVLQYAYNKLGWANGAADPSLTNLLTAMLNYGTAAANFKGNDIDLMADYTYVSVEHATFEDGHAYGLYKKGTTLTVKADFGWKLEDGASDVFSVDGETITFTVPDEKYVDDGSFVEDNDISAQGKVDYEAGLVSFNTTAAYVGDTATLNTATDTYNEVSITWAATGATIADGVVTFDAEGTATLTATISADGAESATKTFPVTVTVNPYPVEGKAYALKTANEYYITEKSTKGFTASQDVFSAISFYFEKAGDGAYYLVCDGQYVATKDSADLSFGATKYAWSLNTTTHQIYAPENNNRFLGLNGTSVKAYATSNNYPAVWFEPIQEWTDADKLADEVKNFTTEYSTNGGTDLNLPTETEKFEASISWALDGEYDFVVSLENGVLVTTNPAEDKTVNVKATISLNGVNSESISCAIAVKHIEEGGGDEPMVEGTLAVFELGEDDSKKSNSESSSDKTTYTEEQGDYTLSLTNGSKMYPGSYGKTGNAVIKLGSSSAAGGFTINVNYANVTKVIIKIAGRQTSTTKVKVNNVEYTVQATSDTSYEEIVVSMSDVQNGKIVLTTTGAKATYRAYVDSITFVGYAQ